MIKMEIKKKYHWVNDNGRIGCIYKFDKISITVKSKNLSYIKYSNMNNVLPNILVCIFMYLDFRFFNGNVHRLPGKLLKTYRNFNVFICKKILKEG